MGFSKVKHKNCRTHRTSVTQNFSFCLWLQRDVFSGQERLLVICNTFFCFYFFNSDCIVFDVHCTFTEMHCVLYIALFSVSCQAFCHWFRLTSSPSTPPYPNTHRLSELISRMLLMWNTGYELQGHGAPFHCPTVSTAARTAKERLFFGLF